MIADNIRNIIKQPVVFVACHRLPNRSFFFRGRQFPLCARCTGLSIGYLFYPLFVIGLINLPLLLIVLMHFPMIIDGLTQYLFERESTNALRLVTGLLAGISQVGFLDHIALHSARYILNLF